MAMQFINPRKPDIHTEHIARGIYGLPQVNKLGRSHWPRCLTTCILDYSNSTMQRNILATSIGQQRHWLHQRQT